VAHFVTARAGALLRGQMAPVLDAQGAVTGFVLLLEDITRSVEINSRRDVLLQQLTEGIRASLANIRAAAETVQQHPQMEPARRQRFTEVIREEAQRLSIRVDQTLARGADTLRAPWPLEDMLAADLVFALQRNFEVGAGVTACPPETGEPLWLAVDSHSLVQALTHVMGRLRARFGTRAVTIELAAEGRFARLTMRWTGPPVDPALMHEWEQQPISMGGDGQVATLKEVIERHGGELWCQSDRTSGANSLSVQLPLAPSERAATPASVAAQGRPVYYDFDLFSQPGQTPELDERELTALTYTVFDTETTGLEPSQGDEIISIGAVRIVNGRLLEQECFDHLVNPRRSVRKESQQVHGLTADMLADQPGIEGVLPAFQRFAEDTVLVAHNAAFDMRFLQLKEVATGIRFVQPVLDTLLLSALVHPGHADADHTLERIAERLGIPVMGRHTALGDAIVTGEVFLKLIPLLAERGIRTLRQAREASQKTLYAKLEY
jgi:DNA polymerase-3 subunit epsilon